MCMGTSGCAISTLQPGIGLGEHLADLGVIQQQADLLERPPTIPLSGRVLDMFRRTGQVRRVADLDDVVGDGLHDLAAAADVGVGERLLESLAKRPVDQRRLFVELARGRLRASTRRSPRLPWETPTCAAGCAPSPSGGSGTTAPDRLPSGRESRRRIAHETWSCRGAT